MTQNPKTERLTVDLLPDTKNKLRLITAVHGEKYMQKMVIRLIEECYNRCNLGSISQAQQKMNFTDEEMRNLRA
jgi:hypothetical protein